MGRIVKLPAAPHRKTIEKITRGFYAHHFQEILPAEATVETYYFNELSEELRSLGMGMRRHNIGGDEKFVYSYGRTDNGMPISIWIYQFYNSHWAAAFTSPTGYDIDQADVVPEAFRSQVLR